jgi:Outer membrane protein and related peptidoglycan-associated (lipo)proteins
MSLKAKLFASVAAPIVALPLMIQPAAAVPLKPVLNTETASDVIHVQEKIIVPEGGDEGGGERERPRRRESAGEGEGAGEGQGQGRRAQREQAPAEEEPAKPRRQRPAEAEAPAAEAPAAEAPARERPRRQQAEGSEGGNEQPRRQRQEAGQDDGGAERPRRERQEAAPEAEKPRTQEAQQPREAAPEGNDRQERRNARDRKAAPEADQAETPAERPRGSDTAATPEKQPEKPARRNTERKDAETGTDAAQDQASPRDAKPGDAKPGDVAPGRNAPAQARPGVTTDAQAPQRETTEGQPAPEAPAAPGAPGTEQAAPAQGQPGEATTAQTPEQVERAKELARDPASAQDGEQVVLPVENGAAVLDSAKETPRARDRSGNDRPRRPQGQQAEQQPSAPPTSDAEAQGSTRLTREQEENFRALAEQRGERLDRRPDFDRPRGWEVRGGNRDGGNRRDRDDDRVIITIDNQTIVRHDDSRRFWRDGREPEYERLDDGRVREIIVRDDGTRIVTIRNRYGEVVRRTREVRGGEEYVLYYAPDLIDNRRGDDYVWRDPGDDLPPMRLTVPLEEYIIDTSSEPDRDYYEFLEQPPVERVERVYSLDEVRYSARIRDKVRRIDLDTITFATGSAEIPMNQATSLRKVADAINKVLEKDPSETFLIEGHTDAVGSDESNLVLSDRRAESVAQVLTDAFGIPPENLATQGYGERYLKVRTEAANQENRRVTVRRITPLVKPVAARQ